VELRYLYVGSDDTGRDVAAWLGAGARLRWRFRHFGADVAAVEVGEGPALLVADHRPPGSVLPIYAVADLDEAVARLTESGWRTVGGPLGTPEGPAALLRDASGTEIALLVVRVPRAMEDAYGDPANRHAVRSDP
jgi:hypothetical protein